MQNKNNPARKSEITPYISDLALSLNRENITKKIKQHNKNTNNILPMALI